MVSLMSLSVAGQAMAQPSGATRGSAPKDAQADATNPVPPPPPATTASTSNLRLSPEEQKAFDDIEKDFSTYSSEAERHRERVNEILMSEYQDRTQNLEKRYADKIAAAEREERERRLTAIAALQKFIADYPQHPTYTPDAMFSPRGPLSRRGQLRIREEFRPRRLRRSIRRARTP